MARRPSRLGLDELLFLAPRGASRWPRGSTRNTRNEDERLKRWLSLMTYARDGNRAYARRMTTPIIVEATYASAIQDEERARAAELVEARLAEHGGRWERSYLSPDRLRAFHHVEAPDVAAVEAALHAAEAPFDRAWTSFKYEATTSQLYALYKPRTEPATLRSTIVVFTEYDSPLSDEGNAGMSKRVFPCLELYGAGWVRSFLATDRLRMLCEFQAADTETLRLLLRSAKVTFGPTWRAEKHERRADGP
jgi:hypothetical protein